MDDDLKPTPNSGCWFNEDIEGYRKLANEKRQSLREQYARLRKFGTIMTAKGWVTWSAAGHSYEHSYAAPFLGDRIYSERKTINALFQLQENISQQAMLLLELEWTCDQMEEKRNKQQERRQDGNRTDVGGDERSHAALE